MKVGRLSINDKKIQELIDLGLITDRDQLLGGQEPSRLFKFIVSSNN